MNKSPLFLLASLLVTLAALFVSGCSQDAGESDEVAVTEEDPAEREARARLLLTASMSSVYEDKISGLTEVAHVYWDTEVGPKAARELIFYLLDAAGDDPETAMKELERIRRRRPESEEVMTAAMILTSALQSRLLAGGDDPKREIRERLFERGKKIWMEVADDLCERPEFRNRADMALEWGNVCMLAGDFEKAERVWGRVESMDPPAIFRHRHQLLIKRANLLRERLDDDARSLELFEQAKALQASHENMVNAELTAHIDEAIADLKAKLGR